MAPAMQSPPDVEANEHPLSDLAPEWSGGPPVASRSFTLRSRDKELVMGRLEAGASLEILQRRDRWVLVRLVQGREVRGPTVPSYLEGWIDLDEATPKPERRTLRPLRGVARAISLTPGDEPFAATRCLDRGEILEQDPRSARMFIQRDDFSPEGWMSLSPDPSGGDPTCLATLWASDEFNTERYEGFVDSIDALPPTYARPEDTASALAPLVVDGAKIYWLVSPDPNGPDPSTFECRGFEVGASDDPKRAARLLMLKEDLRPGRKEFRYDFRVSGANVSVSGPYILDAGLRSSVGCMARFIVVSVDSDRLVLVDGDGNGHQLVGYFPPQARYWYLSRQACERAAVSLDVRELNARVTEPCGLRPG